MVGVAAVHPDRVLIFIALYEGSAQYGRYIRRILTAMAARWKRLAVPFIILLPSRRLFG